MTVNLHQNEMFEFQFLEILRGSVRKAECDAASCSSEAGNGNWKVSDLQEGKIHKTGPRAPDSQADTRPKRCSVAALRCEST